ncbi:MAG: hypothetical protein A2798_00650 [Candidatus Levybacteria bacterium RIFCSPHIGHO2_01_FULL_37_17]|nr:MAG: hypothetical protein A2798_00650 [Candidatus Levybacteria bacterium RIFCSPHIGHO2_01_FULL_37_17]OGH36964.1 MAG: hypothetical protein A2959_01510 [Candidatus Levybacteria bacterium RIFCSPLOWO2_01_FULL_38_23]
MLFLTSQAYNVLHRLIPLLKDKPENLSVAFIPTAADLYKERPWMDDDRNKLVELGFNVFDLDLKNKNEEDLKKILSNVNLIFVAGGNTFYLLEKCRKSGFDKLIRQLLDRGVVYIGSSAGSVIAGPDIEAVKDFDDPDEANLESTTGFGLVNFVTLPHFKNAKYSTLHDKVIKEYGKKYNIIPITDQQAVLVQDTKNQVIEA